MATITLVLYRRNSIGDRYLAPTVVETVTVQSEREADQVLSQPMVNGFYYRREEA